MFLVNSRCLSGPLYNVDQMPEHFHESFIVKGYRHPKSTLFQCILSVFTATNETLNFWTHFLPSFYFIWVLRGLSDTVDFQHDSYSWPLLVFMCTSVIYPLASSTAHTFNTMSDEARHICFFLDYSAISLHGLSSAIVYRAYSFPSELRFTTYGDLFVSIATVNALLCIIISCDTRFMKPGPFRKILRICSLGLPCMYDIAPILYRLFYGTPDEMQLTSWTPHLRGVAFCLLAGFLYGSHLPERLYPGSFDIVGHSHQLFHVSSILGTIDQIQAVLNDYQDRRSSLEPRWEFGNISQSIGLLGSVMVINTLVVILFSYRIHRWHKRKVKSF